MFRGLRLLSALPELPVALIVDGEAARSLSNVALSKMRRYYLAVQ